MGYVEEGTPEHAELQRQEREAAAARAAHAAQEAQDVAEGRRLASTPLVDAYRTEDVDASWQSPLNPLRRDLVVGYDRTEDAQDATRVHTDDAGLLRDSSGALLSGSYGWVIDPATSRMHVFEEHMGWVTDATGERSFISKDEAIKKLLSRQLQSVATIHHSSMLAGAPVAGAGQLTCKDGSIVTINDVSGHYRPSSDITNQAIGLLVEEDYSMSRHETVDGMTGPVSARIELLGAASPDGKHTGKQWVGEDASLYQGMVSLTPEQYLQTQGNEEQIRRKASLNEIIAGAGENLSENLQPPAPDGPGDPAEDAAYEARLAESRRAAEARMSAPLSERTWQNEGDYEYDEAPGTGMVGGLEAGHDDYLDGPPPESW